MLGVCTAPCIVMTLFLHRAEHKSRPMNCTDREYNVSYSTDLNALEDPDILECVANHNSDSALRCQFGLALVMRGGSDYITSFPFDLDGCPSLDPSEVPIHVPVTGLAAERQSRQRAWVKFQSCAQ